MKDSLARERGREGAFSLSPSKNPKKKGSSWPGARKGEGEKQICTFAPEEIPYYAGKGEKEGGKLPTTSCKKEARDLYGTVKVQFDYRENGVKEEKRHIKKTKTTVGR